MSLYRRALLQRAALVAALPAWAVAQQTLWPAKALRIVVPFPPGGTTDFVTRLVATELTAASAQPVVVENKPGAGTVIGVDAVAKSAPDGSSFVTVANSFAANQTLVKKLPYDTLGDLRAVALMGLSEHVLATHPGSGLESIADLREQVKAGARLSYASFGNGTSAHLSGEMLKLEMGIPDDKLVHVPYKGQGPALADLLGGQVTLMFGNWPEFRSHIAAGKLVALGMATLERSRWAPDIPTLAEQGVPIESNSWNGLLAPAGTPDEIVDAMNAAVNRALASAPVQAAFDKAGIRSMARPPQQFAAFIEAEIVKYADVIRRADIQLG